MTRIADERGITEERKATDPMPRMRKMNGIKASVENTTPNTIIFPFIENAAESDRYGLLSALSYQVWALYDLFPNII